MKKEKAFPRHRKERTFSLHSTATNHANDETEEKEEHLQTFSPAKQDDRESQLANKKKRL